jgi:Zn-dependent protease
MLVFVPFLFSLCFHELAHGLVAKWKGDRTAELQGRLTLNPMAHADPIGTWALPLLAITFNSGFFFGWAKPVPVDTRNLRGKMDMFWIAAAGPLSNVFLAVIGAIGLGFIAAYMHSSSAGSVVQLVNSFIGINLFLAVFNLIPIHPLDGGKIIEPFLPGNWNTWLLENQMQLNMFLLLILLLGGGILAMPVLLAKGVLLQLSSFIAQNLV